jgi:hypothetical protein
VILLLLSHECETWSLILRGEHRLRANGKMLLRKIYVDKMEEFRRV